MPLSGTAPQDRGAVLRRQHGEKAAAAPAADRLRARLRQEEKREKSVEMRFSLPDPWSRQMFIALCRRYGLRPYRYARVRRQSVMVRAPETFLNTVLWPEFPGDQFRPQREIWPR